MYGEHWSFFGGGFMWLLWILIIAVIALLLRSLFSEIPHKKPTESALDILKKRYARGEIDDEEYQQRRQKLEE